MNDQVSLHHDMGRMEMIRLREVKLLPQSHKTKGKHSPPNFLRQKLYFSTEYTKSATKYLVNVPVTFKSAFNMKKS